MQHKSNKMILNIEAAVIGMWRMGADQFEIGDVFNLRGFEVHGIVESYRVCNKVSWTGKF